MGRERVAGPAAGGLPVGVTVEDMWALRGVSGTDRQRVKRWRWRVRVPGTNQRETRSTRQYDEGLLWALQVRMGLEQARTHAGSGRSGAAPDDGAAAMGGAAPGVAGLSFAAAAERLLRSLELAGRTPAHVDRIRTVLAHWMASDGYVDDILATGFADAVRHWCATVRRFDNCADDLSGRTRNHHLQKIRQVTTMACRAAGMLIDPLAGIPGFAEQRKRRETLALDEIRRCLAQREHAWWLFFALGVYTGMREGEILHMRWSSVREESREIRVRFCEGWAPKGYKERDIALQPELAQLLRPLAERAQSDWLFPARIREGSTKGPWVGFRDLMFAAQVDGRRYSPHCMRHTYISLMLATGERVAYIRDYAGHAAMSMTDQYSSYVLRYRHLVEDWPRGEFRLL